jgi:hypothetical protein
MDAATATLHVVVYTTTASIISLIYFKIKAKIAIIASKSVNAKTLMIFFISGVYGLEVEQPPHCLALVI